MPSTVRLAVLNSHPIQYSAPFYAHMNADPSFDVTVLYMSDASLRGGQDRGFGRAVAWDIDLLSGYKSLFLGEAAKRRMPGDFFSLIVPEVWNAVRSGGYDAMLVHGHQYAANLIAIAAAKSVGMPVLIRGETHLGLVRGNTKRMLRGPVMGAVYSQIARAMAIGTANAAFYRAMGVPKEKIFLAPYCVDNDRFIRESRLKQSDRLALRTRLGIPEDHPAILYAAKFTQRKRPHDLLKAALRLRQKTTAPFSLVMCGSGELEPELRAFVQANALDNVIFTGFINQADLPRLYGACDVFVLPSEDEPWGLAVNEAMCAALPIVVSREIGCVADLVSDGVNGFTPGARDVDALTAALQRLVEDGGLRSRQGAASLERIANWGYRECLNGFRDALVSLKK